MNSNMLGRAGTASPTYAPSPPSMRLLGVAPRGFATKKDTGDGHASTRGACYRASRPQPSLWTLPQL